MTDKRALLLAAEALENRLGKYAGDSSPNAVPHATKEWSELLSVLRSEIADLRARAAAAGEPTYSRDALGRELYERVSHFHANPKLWEDRDEASREPWRVEAERIYQLGLAATPPPVERSAAVEELAAAAHDVLRYKRDGWTRLANALAAVDAERKS